MIRKYLYLSIIIFLSGTMCGCIGGTSQKSVYYVFSASRNLSTVPSLIGDRGLGVGPIKIPAFLNRPQIVTRQGQNLLSINEFHRWGDSLEAQITGVLVENLSTLLNTPNISIYPWERPFLPEYQLYIDFRRFDGKTAESVTLDAVWWIVDTNNDKRLLTRRSSLVEPTHGDGYKAYVIALNTVLEKFCRKITDGVIDVLP